MATMRKMSLGSRVSSVRYTRVCCCCQVLLFLLVQTGCRSLSHLKLAGLFFPRQFLYFWVVDLFLLVSLTTHTERTKEGESKTNNHAHSLHFSWTEKKIKTKHQEKGDEKKGGAQESTRGRIKNGSDNTTHRRPRSRACALLSSCSISSFIFQFLNDTTTYKNRRACVRVRSVLFYFV